MRSCHAHSELLEVLHHRSASAADRVHSKFRHTDEIRCMHEFHDLWYIIMHTSTRWYNHPASMYMPSNM